VDSLIRAARRRPLVLLLDDLDRADREAISRLETLITIADEGARILIVGAYRPTPPGAPNPPVHTLRKTLPRQGELFVHRRLTGLELPELAAWLADRFGGSAIPQLFLEWLHGATGGHPGTVLATLDHLQAEGAVRRVGEGWEFETDRARLELPRLGQSFADLSAVNPYIAEVVVSAAVMGDRFDARTLSELLERDELAVEDQLALGVHYGLLVGLGDHVGMDGEPTSLYRFASAHLRAALLESLPAERRFLLERREAARRQAPEPVPPIAG
jgi:predicted ATPase